MNPDDDDVTEGLGDEPQDAERERKINFVMRQAPPALNLTRAEAVAFLEAVEETGCWEVVEPFDLAAWGKA